MTLTKMISHDFLGLEQARDCAAQSEMTLVHSAQSGNLDAFNALVLKYQDVLYRTALRILGQETLAVDATQDAFISAFQHISNFRGGSLKAWLIMSNNLVTTCTPPVTTRAYGRNSHSIRSG